MIIIGGDENPIVAAEIPELTDAELNQFDAVPITDWSWSSGIAGVVGSTLPIPEAFPIPPNASGFRLRPEQSALLSFDWANGTVTLLRTGTTELSWTAENADGSTVTKTMSVLVSELVAPMTVSIVPAQQTIYEPDPLILTALVKGGREPYSATWFHNGKAISGQTSTELTIPTTSQAADAGIYYAQITDSLGTVATAASVNVAIIKRPPVKITKQPVGGEYPVGTDIVLSVDWVNEGVVQWQEAASATGEWADIAGATAKEFRPPSALVGTVWYRAVVTGSGTGTGQDISNVAAVLLTSVETAPVFTLHPSGGLRVITEGFTMTAAATGAATWQWQKLNGNGTSWDNISGATSDTLTLPALTMDDNGWYRAEAGTASGLKSQSNSAQLVIESTYLAIRKQGDDTANINTPPISLLAKGRQSLDLTVGTNFTSALSRYTGDGNQVVSGGSMDATHANSNPSAVSVSRTGSGNTVPVFQPVAPGSAVVSFESVDKNSHLVLEVNVKEAPPIPANIVVTPAQIPVTYSGLQGSGVPNTTAVIAGLTITLSPTKGLYNGDKVYATLVPDSGHTVNGKAMDTFEYTVSGLSAFTPPALKWVTKPPAAAIAGDTVAVAWSGGVAPYTAKIVKGTTETVLSSDETTSISYNSASATNGTYTWRVTDSTGAYIETTTLMRVNLEITATGLPITFSGRNVTGTASIGEIANATSSLSKSTGLSNGDVITVTVTAASEYRVNRKASDSFKVTVTGLENVAPMDFDQNLPGSSVTIPVLDSTKQVLTVSVTGGTPPYSYVWKKDGAIVSGATGASLTIASMAAANAGTYVCEVTDSSTPAKTLVSQEAVVTYMPYPGFVGFHTYASGSSASTVPQKTAPFVWNGEGDQELNIAIGDAPFTAVARKYRAGTTTIYPGSGVARDFTGANPAIATVVRNSATSSYQMVITPVSLGSFTLAVTETDGSATGNLKINIVPNTPPTITQQPKDYSIKEGATVSIVCKGSSVYGAVSYQWYWRPKGDSAARNALVNETNGAFGTVSGVATNTLKFTAATPAAGDNKYWCEVSDARGSTKSEEFVIDVLANQYYIGFKRANQTGGTPGQTAPWGWIAEGEQTLTLAATAANYSAWLGRYFKGSLTSSTTLGDWEFTNANPEIAVVTKPANNTLTFDPIAPGTTVVLVTTTDGRAVGKVTVTIT